MSMSIRCSELFFGTAVQFAPAVNCPLHLPDHTPALAGDQAVVGSDSFRKKIQNISSRLGLEIEGRLIFWGWGDIKLVAF